MFLDRSCRDPSDLCPSFLCGWLLPHSHSKTLAKRWAVMVSKRKRVIAGFSGQVRAEEVLADAITIDGRKEWICKFFSETNVWTRWRCRRCYSNIPAGLQEKYRLAVSAKTRAWSSGSSSSNGGEGKWPRDQDAEIKELRALNSSGGSREWRWGRECEVSRRKEKVVLSRLENGG